MKVKKQFFMYLAFAIMITVNALANILPLNGYQTGEISNLYPVLFTPAGYVFSIWSVIYIGLFLWLLSFSMKKQRLSNAQYGGFLVTCLFNALWIIAWHYLYDGLALLIITGLLVSIFYLYQTQRHKNKSTLMLLPISLYLGWIIVATLSNLSYWLVASIEIGASFQFALTYVLFVLTTVLAFSILYFLKDWGIIAVFIWAMIGIFVKNQAAHTTLALTVLGLTVLIGIAALGYWWWVRKKQTPKYHF